MSWAESLEKEAELKAEAAKWFRLAADQGYAPAQFQLGRYYEYGCVSRTFDKQLGGSYEDGRVTRNFVEAYKWFHLASAQGYVDEIIQKSAITYRGGVAALMTPDQIAEAQRLALEFRPHLTPDQIAEAQRLAREFQPHTESAPDSSN